MFSICSWKSLVVNKDIYSTYICLIEYIYKYLVYLVDAETLTSLNQIMCNSYDIWYRFWKNCGFKAFHIW